MARHTSRPTVVSLVIGNHYLLYVSRAWHVG